MVLATLVRRLSSFLPGVPVFALAALSIATAAQVGCGKIEADDGTREDSEPADGGTQPEGYGYASDGAGCTPAAGVHEVKSVDASASCTEVCEARGMKCNEHGYAVFAATPIPVYPYGEPPSCHYAGRRVSYACETCYSGSDFTTCDGKKEVWSTVNYKSGPYDGTYCTCSPE